MKSLKIIFFSLILIFSGLLITDYAKAGSCGTPGYYPGYSCVKNPNENYTCAPGDKDNKGNLRCDNPDEKCCRLITSSGPSENSGTTIPNPIGTTDIKTLIGRILKTILGITGSLALALFIYGGLTFMTAGGKPEQIQKGKDTLIWAVIGLTVIFTSYVILNFVLQTLVKINS